MSTSLLFTPQKYLIILLTIHLSAHEEDFDNPIIVGGRIIGGTDVKENEFPYMVSLSRIKTREHYDVCGGTYIHEYWVLTAAHCTKPNVTYRLYLGITYSGLMANRTTETRDAIRIVVHKKYRLKPTPRNDLALIGIDRPFGDSSNLIYIPRHCEYKVNSMVLVLGLGATRLMDIKQNKTKLLRLQKLYSKIKTREYNSDPNTFFIGDYGANVCFGDSGGPIVYRGKLIGVVSSIGTTAEKNCEATYARGVKIVMYRRWINSVILGALDYDLESKNLALACVPNHFYFYIQIILILLIL